MHETIETSDWLMLADDLRSIPQLLAVVPLWRATAVSRCRELSPARRNFTGDRGSWGSPTKFVTAQYTERASVLRTPALAHRESKDTFTFLYAIN